MAKKKNAWEEAQQLFGTVFNAGKNAVSTAVSSLPRISQAVDRSPVLRNVGSTVLRSVPMTAPLAPIVQRGQTQNLARLTRDYSQGQIIQPIKTGVSTALNPRLSVPNRALGAAQAAGGFFNLTPAGALTTGLTGIAAGATRSLRTGQPLAQSVRAGLTTPTSLFSQGLGVQHQGAALLGDFLTSGNPKDIIKNTKSLSALLTTIRKGPYKMVADGLRQTLDNQPRIIDVIKRFEINEGYLPNGQADLGMVDEAYRLHDLIYGANKKAPQQISKVVERLKTAVRIARNQERGGNVTKSFDIPKMGIAGDMSQTPPVTSQNALGSVPNPNQPFYNVNRMGVPQQTKQAVKDFVQSPDGKAQMEAAVGETLTHKEVNTMAQVVPELAKQYTREDALQLGAQAQALRNKVAELSQLGVNDEQFQEALVRDKAFGAFLARLFGQRQTISDPSKSSIFNEVIGKIIKAGHDPEEVIAAAKGVDFENPNQLTAFFRQFIKPSKEDWADLIRYNSMLSSPLTQIVNITSNVQGTGLMTPLQKTVEGALDAIASAFSGKERTRYAGEGLAYAGGYAGATKQAFKDFFDTFKGNLDNTNPDTRQIPLTTGGIKRAGENVLRVPSTTLEAFDRLFMRLTKSGLEASSKYRLSRAGKPIPTQNAAKEAEKLLYRGKLSQKGEGLISEAIGGGGEWVKKATRSDSKLLRWTAKMTLPFVNIGTNLAKQGAEFNPLLGSLNMIGNTDKTAQASKLLIGGAITAAAVPLAMSDRLTFGNTPRGRDAAESAGIQPYSVKIGDQWIQYSKLHPALAFQLAMTAAITEQLKSGKLSETGSEKLANGVWNSLRFIADATYFKNVGDFVAGVNGDVEGVTRLVSNYPAQAVPYRALFGWINRMVDHYQRKPETDAGFFVKGFQQIATQIPGLSQSVPMRYGPDGQPLKYQNPVLNAFSPARVTTEIPENKKYYEESKGAAYLYQQLKALPREEVIQRLVDLKQRNPNLYGQIKTVARQTSLGLTPKEVKMGDLGIGSGDRARAISKELDKLQSSEEKKAYVVKLIRGKILTKDVAKQIGQMKKQNQL